MSERNLNIITKIILFYSIFYVGVKLFYIFQGAWLVPNLIVAFPFVILALVSGYIVKSGKYSWIFAGVGAAVIILTRIYEKQLVLWLQDLIAG